MEKSYSPAQLSIMATILARCAEMRDWGSADLATGKCDRVEEIQCMMLDEKLYIAGNGSEWESVESFLSAFGATGGDNFLQCLSLCHWLLTMGEKERKSIVAPSFVSDKRGRFSEQDKNTLKLIATDDKSWPLPALGDEVKSLAQRLMQLGLKADDKPRAGLGWFLLKLTGLAPTIPSGLKAHYVKAPAKVSTLSSVLGQADVNIVSTIGKVHAELKLLAYMWTCHRAKASALKNAKIPVGGLKSACKKCGSWIEYFQALLDLVPITIELEASRADGSGAGCRPLLSEWDIAGFERRAKDTDTDKKLSPGERKTWARYAYENELFNGVDPISNAELDARKQTLLDAMRG